MRKARGLEARGRRSLHELCGGPRGGGSVSRPCGAPRAMGRQGSKRKRREASKATGAGLPAEAKEQDAGVTCVCADISEPVTPRRLSARVRYDPLQPPTTPCNPLRSNHFPTPPPSRKGTAQ